MRLLVSYSDKITGLSFLKRTQIYIRTRRDKKNIKIDIRTRESIYKKEENKYKKEERYTYYSLDPL